ncbi:hypothetical protein RFI_28310 [Reticulomyxa filosa]|uniref:Uncharacterized protein n=1 Tax=Reticulomyxa filosa TaxID=46433 RepID=X6M516_RETFI|nr:hypothetical protein RFI_28310 [Reticulomyxa filosa]|eukprot:ETO09078.1 hypothetical protein RFI_28310 [Reticulomyxa filosa]
MYIYTYMQSPFFFFFFKKKTIHRSNYRNLRMQLKMDLKIESVSSFHYQARAQSTSRHDEVNERSISPMAQEQLQSQTQKQNDSAPSQSNQSDQYKNWCGYMRCCFLSANRIATPVFNTNDQSNTLRRDNNRATSPSVLVETHHKHGLDRRVTGIVKLSDVLAIREGFQAFCHHLCREYSLEVRFLFLFVYVRASMRTCIYVYNLLLLVHVLFMYLFWTCIQHLLFMVQYLQLKRVISKNQFLIYTYMYVYKKKEGDDYMCILWRGRGGGGGKKRIVEESEIGMDLNLPKDVFRLSENNKSIAAMSSTHGSKDGGGSPTPARPVVMNIPLPELKMERSASKSASGPKQDHESSPEDNPIALDIFVAFVNLYHRYIPDSASSSVNISHQVRFDITILINQVKSQLDCDVAPNVEDTKLLIKKLIVVFDRALKEVFSLFACFKQTKGNSKINK